MKKIFGIALVIMLVMTSFIGAISVIGMEQTEIIDSKPIENKIQGITITILNETTDFEGTIRKGYTLPSGDTWQVQAGLRVKEDYVVTTSFYEDRCYMSFDTSSIPDNAIILSATLGISYDTKIITGAGQDYNMRLKYYPSAGLGSSLSTNDWNVTGAIIGTMVNTASSYGYYTVNVTPTLSVISDSQYSLQIQNPKIPFLTAYKSSFFFSTASLNITYIVMTPIRIDSDAGFNTTNGVTAGTGTSGDPYIIDNWNINATGYGCGIYVGNTTKHFVIRNCTVYNASGYVGTQYYYNNGIYLHNLDYSIMLNNSIYNNRIGIYASSINGYNNITRNNISNNTWEGIYLDSTINCTINNNTVSNNNYAEIHSPSSSNNNTIMYNNISSIESGVGIYLEDSSDNNVTGNNISGGLGIYLEENSHFNNIIDNNVTASFSTVNGISLGGFGSPLTSPHNNTISNNSVNSANGIYLSTYAQNNTITYNNISGNGNGNGIFLEVFSNNNTISNNNITGNVYGIEIAGSSYNTLYHNNLISNSVNAEDNGINYWNSTYQFGGNYWDDYTGVDIYHGINQDKIGSDGIGDWSYNFTTGNDYYPLMNPMETNNTPLADAGVDLWTARVHHVNGTNSSDAGGTSLNYTWNFTYSATPYTFWNESFDFDFAITGNYTITLNVTDDNGNYDIDIMVVHAIPLTADAGADDIALRNVSYQFNGTGTLGNVVNYTWNFTDSGAKIIYGGQPNYIFTSLGIYNVTLNVTDFWGDTDEDWILITVVNNLPVADAGINQTYGRGIHSLDGSGSSDFDGTISNYTWIFNDGGLQTLYSINPSYNYTNIGLFVTMLKVTDNNGGFGYDNVTLNITNVPPVANAGVDQAGQKGNYVMSGNASYDSDWIGIDYYNWTFNYNSTQYWFNSTSWFEFYFYQEGDYEITLNVTDSDGAYDQDTTWVNITWLNPIADAGSNVAGKRVLSVDGSGSYDTDGWIVDYNWSFTYDGTPTYLSGDNPSFDFNISGSYIILLRVTDNDGLFGFDNVTVTVTILPPVAVANYEPNGSTNKGTFLLDASSSFDLDGTITNYTWTFNYGGIQTLYGEIQAFNFLVTGNYELTLNITDDDWRYDEDVIWINITLKDPQAIIEMWVNNTYKGVKVFDATSSTDEDGTIVNYTWVLKRNTVTIATLYGLNVSYDTQLEGTYEMILTVTDDDTLTGEKSKVFLIIFQTPVANAGEDQIFVTDGGSNSTGNVTLNGSLSSDVDGFIVNWTWSYVYYNVTYYLYGEVVDLVVYNNESYVYNITLNVTDENGLTSEDTVFVRAMTPMDVAVMWIYWLIVLTIVGFVIMIILRKLKQVQEPFGINQQPARGKKKLKKM